jgi:hypothetical protein
MNFGFGIKWDIWGLWHTHSYMSIMYWYIIMHNIDKNCVFLSISVACTVSPSITTFSTDYSFQNLVFWNLFEFSVAEVTKTVNISHILNPNLTK